MIMAMMRKCNDDVEKYVMLHNVDSLILSYALLK